MKYLVIALALFLTSCSHFDIQKRHYRSGFYVNKSGAVENVNPIVTSVEPCALMPSVEVLPACEVIEEPLKESVSLMSVNEAQAVPALSLQKELLVVQKQNPAIQKVVTYPQPEDGMDSGTMILLGWICAGLAIVSLFVLWPLVFFIVPAVILLILGYSKKNGGGTTKSKSSDTMEDVVYLKNGSIIRGTIIEQVPNVSLKIQTRDGSVFFYKMEEVEKITKEKAVN